MTATAFALLQETVSSDSSSNVVLYIAAMSSFVAFVGVVVGGFVQWSASRAAIVAAREAREAAKEARDEQRVNATEQKKTLDNVEHLVNSKSDKQTETIDLQTQTIKDLTEQIKQMNATALAKAEAAPPIGGTPMATPTATIPVKVVVVDTEKPIDVIDKTPTKSGDK